MYEDLISKISLPVWNENNLVIWSKIGMQLISSKDKNLVFMGHDVIQSIYHPNCRYYQGYLKLVYLLMKRATMDEYVYAYTYNKRVKGIGYLRVKRDKLGNYNIYFKNKNKYLLIADTYKLLKDAAYKTYEDLYNNYDTYWK